MFKNINKNMIIVNVDGGICSQIAFYVYAYYFQKKGFNVKFDLSFFNNWSKDINGNFARNFDLTKAFKNLDIKIPTDKEIRYYRKHFDKTGKNIQDIIAPAYIQAYPAERGYFLVEFREFLKKNFIPDDIDRINSLVCKCSNKNACAVHVRRGDLNCFNSAYGYPTNAEYFDKAIKIIKSFNKDVIFYFFSDEPDYVVNSLIPKLEEKINFEVISDNGSDKGYLDLYLMSKCNYIIASQGSLGLFAKILADDSTTLITPIYRSSSRLILKDYVVNTMKNIIILSSQGNKDFDVSFFQDKPYHSFKLFGHEIKISK